MTENDGNERSLTQQESLAIQLKYEGESNLKISQSIGKSVNTIEHWFGDKGKLSKEYISYSKDLTDTAKEEASLTIKRNLDKAAKTIVTLLESDKVHIRLSAARDILDRELGRAKPQEGSLFDEKDPIPILSKPVRPLGLESEYEENQDSNS